jgi:hypothetical protein
LRERWKGDEPEWPETEEESEEAVCHGVLLKISNRSLQLTKIGDKALELPSIELGKIRHLCLWLEGLRVRDPGLKIGVVIG